MHRLDTSATPFTASAARRLALRRSEDRDPRAFGDRSSGGIAVSINGRLSLTSWLAVQFGVCKGGQQRARI
jgi:hypothetical protein